MNWLPLILATGVFYGVYNFFIKLSSGHINQIVGAVVLQVVAALLGLGILAILKLNHQPLEITQKGLLLAACAGIFVGLAEITSFLVFSKGIPISSGLPIITGVTIVTGAILGIFLLKESLEPLTILGILLTLSGVMLVTLKTT